MSKKRTREQQEADIEALFDDRVLAIETLCTIENKKRETVAFLLRDYQKRLLKWIEYAEKQPGRWTVLAPKLRQGGVSLLGLAHALLNARMKNGHRTLFLIKNGEDCEPFFDELRMLENSLPDDCKGPKERSQQRAIKYKDTQSSIRILEAGQSEAVANKKGRSFKAHMLWITEAEYIEWLSKLLQGAKGSITPDAVTVLESTMNGIGSHFSEKLIECSTKGKEVEPNVWIHEQTICVFLPFYENPEYTAEVPENFEPKDDKEHEILELGGAPGHVCYRRQEIANSVKDNKSGIDPEMIFDFEYPTKLEDGLRAGSRSFFINNIIVNLSEYWKIRRKFVTFGIIRDAGKPRWIKPVGYNSIDVYDLPEPHWENRYLVFGDCAEGLQTSDWDVTWVFDRLTGSVVAEHRGKFGASIQAEIMMLLGWMYGTAWISWDRTGVGSDRLPHFIREQYPRLLSTREVSNSLIETDYLGIKWNVENKRQACAQLKYFVEEQVWKIPCKSFYDEAPKFVYPEDKPKAAPQAAAGATDDSVMTGVGLAAMHSLLINQPPRETIKINKFATNDKLKRRMLSAAMAKHSDNGAYSGGGYE